MVRNGDFYERLLAEVVNYGQRQHWAYLELRGGRSLMPRAQASLSYYAHALDLSGGPDKILARFEGSLRRGIRKAEREGVRVEVSNTLEAMRIYYALHCETRKKHGVPPQPFTFFLNLFQQMIAKEAGVVVVARHQDVPIAAAVFIHRGPDAIYKFGASDPAFLPLRGNNLLLWEAIRWYNNRGCSSIHFGRTSLSNEGLRRYKTALGTEETLLEYFKYDLRKQAYVVDRDRSEGGFTRLLGCLPRPLFRLAGRMLYRHLS
jgi:lipid II:glycine glycyltransferase (peptidoglycan interpeptide bridge formation enzyme)